MTDEEVFGTAPQKPKGLSDAEVFGTPQPQTPSVGQIARTAGEAALNVGKQFVVGIPRMLTEAIFPERQAIEQLGQAGRLISGQPAEQVLPSNPISEAEKTPPFSRQRFETGFSTLTQILGLAAGVKGFEARPLASETAAEEVKQSASQVPSTTSITQPKIRPRVGEETPLRQQRQTAEARQAQAQEVAGVPQPEQPQILSTAVQREGQILQGQSPTDMHADIGTQHGIGEPPESERGFIVQEPNGTTRFVGREEGGTIADQAGQRPQQFSGQPLASEHLQGREAEVQPVQETEQTPAVAEQPKTKIGGVGEEVQKRQDEGQGGQVLETLPSTEAAEVSGAETPPAAVGVPAETVPFIEGSPQVGGVVPFEETRPSVRQITTPTEPIRVKPLTALKSVYEAAEKAGTAGYKRGFREARAEGQAAVSQIKGELSVADKWLAGDQEKVRQNMVEYVNKTLPPAERGRFIGAITKALRRPPIRGGDPSVMYRHAFNVFKLIEKRSEQVYKGGLIDDIKSTISKSVDSPSVDVAYRRQLKDVLGNISMTRPSESTLSRLRSMQSFVEKERAAGREPNIPKEHLDELSTLGKLPLKDMPINALEQLRDHVDNLVSLGKVKKNLLERAWNRSRETAVQELRQQPSNPIEERPMYRPQPMERLTTGQKFLNVVNRMANARLNLENAIAPMDEIYDHLDGARGTYSGWASRNIKGKLDLDRNKTISEWLPIKRQSDAIIKQYGLKQNDFQAVQMKGIIQMIGRERLEAMGVRPDIISKIDSTPLTKGQQAYHDFIRGQYDSVGQRIQDIAHRLYQQDMQIVPDYMPLERDWAAHSEREPPAPLADPSVGEMPFNETATMNQLLRDVNPKILSRTEQGFLRDRIEGAKTAVKLDANEVFERHMQDALHFVNSQGNLKLLGEIVRRPDFAAKYGKTGQNIVLDHLDTIANQGYVNHMQRVRWLDWVRNSTSKGAIGFRVASNFVHTSQLPIAMYHAGGPAWWSKGLELALSEKGQTWLRQNAAETYVRSGGEPAQAEVEAFSKFGRAGFFVARNIDKLNSQATLLGRYAKEMKKAGVPVDHVLDAPVNPDIQSLALRRMHRAVASPQAKDIPQMTSRGAFVGGNVSVARAINQFRNIFLDNWSNVRHDMLRVGDQDAERIINHLRQGELAAGAKQVGDSASHRAAITAALLASVAIETGIKLASKKGIQSGMAAATGIQPSKGKEKETYLGDLKHHLINRVPFAGQIYTAAVYGETGIPTIDAILAPLHEAGQFAKSKKPETQAKHVVRAASAVGTVLGIPGSSQVLEAGQPAIAKTIAPLLPDRSKSRTTKEPFASVVQ